jgi:hypothetical protein
LRLSPAALLVKAAVLGTATVGQAALTVASVPGGRRRRKKPPVATQYIPSHDVRRSSV